MSAAASRWAWQQIRERGYPSAVGIVLLHLADRQQAAIVTFQGPNPYEAVAKAAGCSIHTVTIALKLLQRDGLIERVHGPQIPTRSRSFRIKPAQLGLDGRE